MAVLATNQSAKLGLVFVHGSPPASRETHLGALSKEQANVKLISLCPTRIWPRKRSCGRGCRARSLSPADSSLCTINQNVYLIKSIFYLVARLDLALAAKWTHQKGVECMQIAQVITRDGSRVAQKGQPMPLHYHSIRAHRSLPHGTASEVVTASPTS